MTGRYWDSRPGMAAVGAPKGHRPRLHERERHLQGAGEGPEAAHSAYRALTARGPVPADGGPSRDAAHIDLICK